MSCSRAFLLPSRVSPSVEATVSGPAKVSSRSKTSCGSASATVSFIRAERLASCRRTRSTNSCTTSGSNWAPAPATSSAQASSGDIVSRYGRSEVMAS